MREAAGRHRPLAWALRIATPTLIVLMLLLLLGCKYGSQLKDNTGGAGGTLGDATCGGYVEDGPEVDERGEDVVAWFFVSCVRKPSYHEIEVQLAFRRAHTDEWRYWGPGVRSSARPDREGFRMMVRGPCAEGYFRVAVKRVHGVDAVGNEFDFVEDRDYTSSLSGTLIEECKGRWV